MIKNLDEAISHCEEVAKKKDKEADELNEVIQAYPHEDDILEYTNCRDCASEHRQLAEWLKELQAYRDIIDTADERINNTYGAVIVEGYADVFNNLKEIRDRGEKDGSD